MSDDQPEPAEPKSVWDVLYKLVQVIGTLGFWSIVLYGCMKGAW